MKYYRPKRNMETLCLDKIERGIQSIKNGHRTGDSVDKDLDFFFKKLKEINEPMYEDMYMKYCLIRIEADKNIKDILHG